MAVLAMLGVLGVVAGCQMLSGKSEVLDPSPVASPPAADPEANFPTLDDYWNGNAEFELEVGNTGLPLGESDTVVLSDGVWRSYVHASDRSAGVVDSCGAPVPFPGCVVAYESADAGYHFKPVRTSEGTVACMLPCSSCPCDSRRDHVDQQQYPRITRLRSDDPSSNEWWSMVYEYRGSVFLRESEDGVDWSPPAQIPQTGTWRTWLMPCRSEESVGPHPYAPSQYECLVGGPPGIVVDDAQTGEELYVFVALGQNPGSMGCYRGPVGARAAFLRKCENNPLFTGSPDYGVAGPDAQGNAHFDHRTISSAEVVRVGDRFYIFYEGVRGPSQGDAGDTQFNLGLARSSTFAIDGKWEVYSGNPILLDVPGNIGVGHADIVLDSGRTILYTSLDGETRSRLVLRWKQSD